ncbi:MAG TPA: tetratricopeptide repeat protein [Sphingomicrobium sp.]
MKSAILRLSASAAVLVGLCMAPANAQRVRTPEQRLDRLERQIGQVQRQVFPRGAPAETAGFSDEPAATATSVRTLDERINGLERQMADILRQAEENGHRVSQMETELARLRADNDQRLQSLERAGAGAVEAGTETAQVEPSQDAPPPAPRPKVETASAGTGASSAIPTTNVAPATDPAETAYDEGYQLWRSGKFDQAIASLRAMASSFPGHRRVSWANNLAGRAMLDKGQPRAAAEALLANYRANPKGERAADSLYYLGQSLMKLGQAGQACKAYAELEEVYGASMRAELRRLLPTAKTEASCS